jgi:hypothetical protein
MSKPALLPDLAPPGMLIKIQRVILKKNKFLFTMTAYQKAKGLLRGQGLGFKIKI